MPTIYTAFSLSACCKIADTHRRLIEKSAVKATVYRNILNISEDYALKAVEAAFTG